MTDNERTPDQKRKWTEAEDLRGKARQAVQLATPIADQQSSRALNVYATKLLAKADDLEQQGN